MRKLRFFLIGVGLVAAAGTAVWWFLRPQIHPEDFRVRVERFELESKLVGQSLDQVVVLPQQVGTTSPVVLLLHGRGSSPEGMLNDELFAALRSAGSEAPVIVLANGGDSSYFHDRSSGEWGSYLLDELLPAVDQRWDVDTERVAIGGISMGGFGALDQGRLHPDRYCAIGAHSPAISASAGETAQGAFDDAEDFARHDVLGAVREDPSTYGDTPIWIDVGEDDPFRPATEELGDLLRDGGANLEMKVPPGGHDASYWWSHMDEYIEFYVAALRDCL